MHALRLNLVLSEAQNCFAKDRLALEVCCGGNFIGSAYYFFNFEIKYLGGVKSPL